MPIALIYPATIDLSQPPEPLALEQLHRPMQLGELLFYARVGQLGQILNAKRTSEFQHRVEHTFVS